MFLAEIDINGRIFKVSLGGQDLDGHWDNKIISMTAPQRLLPYEYGGYSEMRFGNIILSPELFTNDWPPPRECAITGYFYDDTLVDKQKIFVGYCQLRKFNREEIEYNIFGDKLTTEVATSTVFNDSLVDIVLWACATARLNLQFDDTMARTPSPDIAYTTTKPNLLINLLSEMSAFFSHFFYIDGNILYLIDMFADNEERTITEYDYFPSEYEYSVPVREVTDGTYSQFSNYAYGRVVEHTSYHDTESNIETALANILTIANKPRATLRMPLAGLLPQPGEKINWTDTALHDSVSAYIRARTLRYDFGNHEVHILGEGRVV